jgi:hypothetical protein
MTKYRAADEHEYACQYRVEKIENANGGDADHEEQRAFNAHIGERLMQALEDSVAAFLCCFLHKPSSVCGWFRENEVD